MMKQTVKGTDTSSDWQKSERGSPQESNFGPLMWNIFQNDHMCSIQTDKSVQCNDVCK